MPVKSKINGNNRYRIQAVCTIALVASIFALIPTSVSSLDVSTDHARLPPNSTANFTINITNSGETSLDPVKVVDTLPAGLSYVSDDKGGLAKGREVTWSNVGRLDVGESIPLHLTTRIVPCASGKLENLVTVTGTPPTGYNVTDSDTEDVFVTGSSRKHASDKEAISIGNQKTTAANSGSAINRIVIKSSQG